jgi:hypothetical protein
MSTKYVVEEADLGEHGAEVVSLWLANLAVGAHASADAQAKLQAGYLDNPAGPGHGLLLRPHGESAAAGVICVHPRSFHFGTQRIRAANLADYAVNAAHRTLGPALMLMKHGLALGRQHFELVYALPNRSAQAVCARVGLTRLGRFSRYARPLSSHRFVPARLRAAATLVAPVADAALRLADALRSLSLWPRVQVREAGFDAPALAALWAARTPAMLLSDRSPGMLRWRYASAARGTWRLCIAHDRAGAAVGHIVWRLRRGAAEVGDFLSLDARRWTAPTMDAFAQHARRCGADSVTLMFFGDPAVVAGLRAAGYRLRDEGEPLFVIAPSIAAASEPQRWHLTAFDNDAD